MTESSRATRADRVLDWAGLIPSGLLLATGIRDYRAGGSVGWLVGGVLMVLISIWVVSRGATRRARDGSPPR
ncbi:MULTISPECIES: hypothetical protein [Streptomyces]|uniref:Uncharacterized protein n=2 Tax=Streptomyces TaxID=1883 RepID=A0A117IUH7_9ACTN|nr:MULTISPECIES: hypothetical protein [Streptomyces]KUH35407.1 hypothetical protein ATE80_29370 [Streptomyces kanasensis]UUS31876.1 hypothetical protein NRO40_14315 [Streptomyces changanensis]